MLTSGLHGRRRTEQHVIEHSVGLHVWQALAQRLYFFVHGFKSGYVMSGLAHEITFDCKVSQWAVSVSKSRDTCVCRSTHIVHRQRRRRLLVEVTPFSSTERIHRRKQRQQSQNWTLSDETI